MVVKIDKTKNELVIRLPLDPHDSKSGKSTVVASTGGNIPTTESHDGKPIYVGVNAYVRK